VDEIKELMGKGDEVGMHTFDQSLYNLYVAKRISLKDALRFGRFYGMPRAACNAILSSGLFA
jgi:Tfp pilus assembly ATPase PilU